MGVGDDSYYWVSVDYEGDGAVVAYSVGGGGSVDYAVSGDAGAASPGGSDY